MSRHAHADRGSMLRLHGPRRPRLQLGGHGGVCAVARRVPRPPTCAERGRCGSAGRRGRGSCSSATLAHLANGAMLVAWERQGRSVVVTVAVDGSRARAHATDGPSTLSNLGSVSDDTGDSASRCPRRLDEIFSSSQRTGRDEAASDDHDGPDASLDDQVEPYELPQIVPATADVPRLPDRATVPEPATTEARTAPTPWSYRSSIRASLRRRPQLRTRRRLRPGRRRGGAISCPCSTGRQRATAAPGRRPRVRRVTRVVRHVDPSSVFKVTLIFNTVAYVVCLTSGVLLWRVADSTGTLDNIERWFTQFGWETFELDRECDLPQRVDHRAVLCRRRDRRRCLVGHAVQPRE